MIEQVWKIRHDVDAAHMTGMGLLIKRLLLAVVHGSQVGYERACAGKPGGMRTDGRGGPGRRPVHDSFAVCFGQYCESRVARARSLPGWVAPHVGIHEHGKW